MKLIEIFTQLTYGELSQVSIGGLSNGEIAEKNYDAVLSHVNLGLTALFKRFPLKQERLTVALQSGRGTYPLTTAYAVSNTKSAEAVKYILDSAAPFNGALFKVEQVYSDTGYEFGLNDSGDSFAITTPSANVLRVPMSVVGRSPEVPPKLLTSNLEVVYRANHSMITQTGSFSPETYEVDLPYSHLEALLLYVASRVHNPIGLVNEFNAGNNYAAKYEMACQALETSNLRVDQGADFDKLHQKGFV